MEFTLEEKKQANDLLSEWQEALRSGKIIQGFEALKELQYNEKTSYCCLGVLGEICTNKDPNLLEWVSASNNKNTLVWKKTNKYSTAYIPMEAWTYYKLPISLSSLEESKRKALYELFKSKPKNNQPYTYPEQLVQSLLFSLNDTYKWKFSEIADVIEYFKYTIEENTDV